MAAAPARPAPRVAAVRRPDAWRSCRGRRRRAGAGLASAPALVARDVTTSSRAYYGTDTRAYQLLAGALLALTPVAAAAVGRRLRSPAVRALAGTALLGRSSCSPPRGSTWGPIDRGVARHRDDRGAARRARGGAKAVAVRALLSLPPIVYLGKISYGTYLWHWLVVIVLGLQFDLTPTADAGGHGRGGDRAGVPQLPGPRVARADLGPPRPLASRGHRRRARRQPAGGGRRGPQGHRRDRGLRRLIRRQRRIGTWRDRRGGRGGRRHRARRSLGVAFGDNFDYDACPSSGSTLCTLAEGEGLVAVVVGDSHAGVWATMLTDLAQAEDMTLLGGLLSFCPWPRGIRYRSAGPNCYADQDDLFDRLLPAADPDIVFLSHRAVDDPNDPFEVRDVDAGIVSGAARDDAVAQRTRETVEALVAEGRTVVIFEPIPVAPSELDPLACLQHRHRHRASCRFLVQREPTPEDLVLRELDAAHEQVVSIDADRLTCPYLPICDPVLDGLVVRRDSNHLTATYARSLEDGDRSGPGGPRRARRLSSLSGGSGARR